MSCISIRNIKEKKTVDLAKSWPGITIKSWYGVNEIKKQKNKNLRKHSETKTGSEEATGIVPWRRNKVSEVVQNSTKLRTFAGNAGRTFKVLKKFTRHLDFIILHAFQRPLNLAAVKVYPGSLNGLMRAPGLDMQGYPPPPPPPPVALRRVQSLNVQRAIS